MQREKDIAVPKTKKGYKRWERERQRERKKERVSKQNFFQIDLQLP